MNYKSKFSEYEYSGRTFFNDVLTTSTKTTNITFTEDKYCPVDVYWNTDFSFNVGEIKFRSGYSSTSPIIVNEGAMLEKSKYDALKEKQKLSGCTPYYIVEFNDGVGYIWNLSDMENVEWKEEKDKYPRTTCGNTEKTTKAVTYLKLDNAKKFKFRTNLNPN